LITCFYILHIIKWNLFVITDRKTGYVRSLIWKTVNDMKKELFEVRPFSGVSIILGAVDEAEMIRKTVETVINECEISDITEFVIMQSQRISAECLESITRMQKEIAEVPINIYVERKPSVGIAIRDGIIHAKGSHTALLSSDFGIHPGCLVDMIEMSKKYPERIIKASRWAKDGSFSGYKRGKLLANKFGNIFLSLLYGTRLSDITNATQLFPSELYKRIRWEEEDFPFLLEMTLKPLRLKVKFVQVSAQCFERTEGKSNNSFKKTFLYLPTAIRNRFLFVSSFYKQD